MCHALSILEKNKMTFLLNLPWSLSCEVPVVNVSTPNQIRRRTPPSLSHPDNHLAQEPHTFDASGLGGFAYSCRNSVHRPGIADGAEHTPTLITLDVAPRLCHSCKFRGLIAWNCKPTRISTVSWLLAHCSIRTGAARRTTWPAFSRAPVLASCCIRSCWRWAYHETNSQQSSSGPQLFRFTTRMGRDISDELAIAFQVVSSAAPGSWKGLALI
jgi:hypothetical protein